MEYLRNKKAGLNFTLQDDLEVGIVLLGTEVKSVKAQHGSLNGSHVTMLNGELVLLIFQPGRRRMSHRASTPIARVRCSRTRNSS
jgi:tmRNA-binding protein